ncbi:MAG: translation initiation factor eIF-2B subunit [Candidatus Aenigmatarchaeota archaeon]
MKESIEEIIEKIKNLEIQGANEIALAALNFLKEYAKENGIDKNFFKSADVLEKVRPTAVVLHNCIESIKQKPEIKTINNLISQIQTSTEKIAKNSVKIIKEGSTILTHCHSGVAIASIKEACKNKTGIKVYATETEPKHQGIKTVKELAEAGIDVTLITDNAVGFFMPKIDLVLVGSDAMRKEGNINKIGSYTIALVAKSHNVPYYVVGSILKLDNRKSFEIEERPIYEVYSDVSKLKGVKIRNPAFDLTPWKYIKRVITEYGIMTPGNLIKLLNKK